jgi:16S rRNA G966 N2-methylase RsmD
MKVRHIDYPVVAKAHTPMYLMHKFWARKPHNVVATYIQRYSRAGEVVLDPFCGSGVTAIEALRLGRKAIAVDLNPAATWVTRLTARPADLEAYTACFRQIEGSIKTQLLNLYLTRCKRCRRKVSAHVAVWRKGASDPTELRYFCPACRRRITKTPDRSDLRLIRRIERATIRNWYPKTPLRYDGAEFKEGTHDPDVERVDQLFTKRNLLALASLFNEINKLQDEKSRELMLFTFTSMVHLASNMTPVRPTRPFSSFWAVHRYWVPPIFMEQNVWDLFDGAVNGKQGVVEGKKESNDVLGRYFIETSKVSGLEKRARIHISCSDALCLGEIVPESFVDYIFTDPPYGGAIQYFELSTLWLSWLRMKPDFEGEVTINEQQGKDFDYYHRMLTAAFKQCYRALKPGRYLTVTFHSTSIQVWNSIIRAVVLAGFDLEKIIYQPPARASAKSLLQPYGSAVGDYYIRFVKPKETGAVTAEEASQENYERVVVQAANKILAERGEPTAYTFILNGIIVELKKHGVLLVGKKDPDMVMRKHVGTTFVLVDATDEQGKKVGKKWWLKDPSSIPYLERVPLSERVERAVLDVLHQKVRVSFDDVLQYVFIKFPNALTPETHSVREILQEYAHETADGNWALKPIVKSREGEHDGLVRALADLGKGLGFKVYADVSGLRTRSLSFGVSREQAKRIREIDVIWYRGQHISFAFEVEHTTAITEAVVRASNIPDADARRVMVIPSERQKLLRTKAHEPLIRDHLKEFPWRIILYEELQRFIDRISSKRRPSLDAFQAILRPIGANPGTQQMALFDGHAAEGMDS